MNIQFRVSNKTESRLAAEFSTRSTISFLVAVLSSHFIRATPSKGHKKTVLELRQYPVYNIVEKVNNEVLGILEGDKDILPLLPILDQLSTSTDEITVFMSDKIIHTKDNWYISKRPSDTDQPFLDSSTRDIFTTDLSGDKHHRGVRVTLNNTFTAGGRCATAFACIYGMTNAEMPHDEIVVRKVPGLIAASDTNGSQENGFVVFIRGNFQTVEEAEAENNAQREHLPQDGDTYTQKKMSKEARVAKLYRELVYYPFIENIRVAYYGHDPKRDVPENLRLISWMDGCLGQLHLTTREDVLNFENGLKITTCKQSAARTGTEQAADGGKMFLICRGQIHTLPGGEDSNPQIYHLLHDIFHDLANPKCPNSTDIVILPNHKKKALLAGLSKLPTAMGAAFKPANVRKAFYGTGQIDATNKIMPSIEGLIGTYRGTIGGNHFLKKSTEIINTFYKEMYTTGMVSESTYESKGVEEDKDSRGNVVSRDFGISKENCQRAKILSSPVQRSERLKLIESIKKEQIKKQISMYKAESTKYELNLQAEAKLIARYNYLHDETNQQPEEDTKQQCLRQTFTDIAPYLRYSHFGRDKCKRFSKFKEPTNNQLKAFIQLRNQIKRKPGCNPVYKSLNNAAKVKLIDISMACKCNQVPPRLFSEPEQQTEEQHQEEDTKPSNQIS